ncbi:uncharacterized protein BP5553_06232 [Venustampulla echinocandica]|uniref:HAT C-terminal dimerisation domain-containing protein n=1 Tax=Venustampulla echinocandica TaxID=2656787 RepID=A0A370T955_9HELO|nr:uncharacterized protein BP5553_10380 [Venustampulla echinocandica]XP_031867315.1 uncharacterized protein BP5553_07461 [Venustampulla echinocandica]XP_031869536.1 uncharacterized protein BP5553_06232 [Venustampulla echinocandica]RDL30102.1 hypothetical protein BP5553_10380 [Venustampulla echinocandica]RDL34333.1 hypothetical protein BP5553_07461 [Venustampulla echinocandica]RDL36880.1 hypothetical protein BP5553_06232 [Venustampulla echinocandica]
MNASQEPNFGSDSQFMDELVLSSSAFQSSPPRVYNTSDINQESVLQRIGKYQQFYQWSVAQKHEFELWWSGTSWYAANNALPRPASLKWEGSRTSTSWSNYAQGAHIRDGKPAVVCLSCQEVLSHPNSKSISTGTKALIAHTRSDKCKKALTRNNGTIYRQSTIYESHRQVAVSTPRYDDMTSTGFVVRFILSLHLSFRTVENEKFRELVQHLCPGEAMVSASTIQRRIMDKVHQLGPAALKNRVPNASVAITLDCWTSPTNIAFMAVNVHYIDSSWNFITELIGFEPLTSTHSGLDLAEVLFNVLEQFGIRELVRTITADNASNNKTLVAEMNELLTKARTSKLTVAGRSMFPQQIVSVPCLSHIFQLVLQAILGGIRVNPTNDELKQNWHTIDEEEFQSEQGSQGLPFTLAKVRKLSIYINSSPQRRITFDNIQRSLARNNKPPLRLIQDVKTRWNSTCLMLIRATKLRLSIDEYTRRGTPSMFRLTEHEWKQVEYLIDLTKPFVLLTDQIGQSKGISIGAVYTFYDIAFTHIEQMTAQLEVKVGRRHGPQIKWIQELLVGLGAAQEKLRKYYTETYKDLGSLYAFAMILTPGFKTSSFQTDSGLSSTEFGTDWEYEYTSQLTSIYTKKYQKKGDSVHKRQKPARARHDLHLILSSTWGRNWLGTNTDNDESELERYLRESPKLPSDSRTDLEWWKDQEAELPALAAFARDILATPAAAVSVERVFNVAKDVCDPRRARLAPLTIRAIMLGRSYDELPANDDIGTTMVDELTLEEQDQEISRREEEFKERLTTSYISDEDEAEVEAYAANYAISRRISPKKIAGASQSLHQETPRRIRRERYIAALEAESSTSRRQSRQVYDLESSPPPSSPTPSSNQLVGEKESASIPTIGSDIDFAIPLPRQRQSTTPTPIESYSAKRKADSLSNTTTRQTSRKRIPKLIFSPQK